MNEEIKTAFASMRTLDDLASLLNSASSDRRAQGCITHVNAKMFLKYAFTKKEYYSTFSIPKRSGGERIISAPCPELRDIQRLLNIVISSMYMPGRPVCGFVPGRSIKDNATVHINKRFVYNMDLKDFFPSVTAGPIKTMLGFEPFCLGDSEKKDKDRNFLAVVITRLCTNKSVLPQGAPTSPMLSNIVCKRLDKRLNAYAKEYKARYTRYADDITLSSNSDIDNLAFEKGAHGIVKKEGFVINKQKVRIRPFSQRQEVTGVVVNRKLNVSRDYLKSLRFYLHLWGKYGYDQAAEKYMADTGRKISGRTFERILRAKIAFLGMIKGREDPVYQRLLARYQEITGGLGTASSRAALGAKKHTLESLRNVVNALADNKPDAAAIAFYGE